MKATVCINNYNYNKVIIDTSSIIQYKAFMTFMEEKLMPELHKCEMKLAVPRTILRELNEFIEGNSNKSRIAQNALKSLESLEKLGYVLLEGDSEERTDGYLLCEVIRARMRKEKVLVITQNYQLATELKLLNQIRAMILPACYMQKINQKGELENFDFTVSLQKEEKTYTNIDKALKKFGI